MECEARENITKTDVLQILFFSVQQSIVSVKARIYWESIFQIEFYDPINGFLRLRFPRQCYHHLLVNNRPLMSVNGQ